MADSGSTSTPPRGEPDVGTLVVGIAGAALSTAGILAAVATLSIGWILIAAIFPVLFWALLLREIHKILRFNGGDDPDGEWLQGKEELWEGRLAPRRAKDDSPEPDQTAREPGAGD